MTAGSKKDEAETIGTVKELQGSGKYLVGLSSGRTVLCYLSGMARKIRSNIIVGDRVRIEVESTNSRRGRIIYRYRPSLNPEVQPATGQDGEPDPPEA